MKKLFCLIALVFSFALSAHRYHVSSAYMLHEPTQKKIKVIIELDSRDLEIILRRITLDDELFLEDLEELDYTDDERSVEEQALYGYLRENLIFENSLAYDLLGFKLKSNLALLYLEVEYKKPSLEGLKVINTMLFRHNDNQVNHLFIEGTNRSFHTSNINDESEVEIVLEE